MFFLVFVLFGFAELKVLDCFYFPLVSETAPLSSNMHLSARIQKELMNKSSLILPSVRKVLNFRFKK